MILISIVAGILSTMNIWADKLRDIRLHLNDIFMISLMTGWMLLLSGYKYIGIITVVVSLFLIRSQLFVNDYQFLSGMIPHHSMAISMGKKIKQKTKNPEIITLANNIIDSQEKEIDLMNKLLKNC